MNYCQVCEDGGYLTKATKTDVDGVPFCDECWFDFLEKQSGAESYVEITTPDEDVEVVE